MPRKSKRILYLLLKEKGNLALKALTFLCARRLSMNHILYGAAYYDEYMPYGRLEQDVTMMKKAGINTVRIAESI